MKKIFLLIVAAVIMTGCDSDDISIFGDIKGSVHSSSKSLTGGLIANVELYQDELLIYSTRSDGADNTFEFNNLDEGVYFITCYKEGYETYKKDVKVIIGETTNLSIILQRDNEK